MEKKQFPLSQNSILAMVMVIALFVFAGFSFDFYYDLNDDVMIKDILSGAYMGTPDAHSIQMLYPISFLISLLYRLVPGVAWQGLFLCFCHGLSLYLIAERSLSFVEKTWKKVALLVTEVVIVVTLFLWELVIVQYTITSALLAACACFLVFTSQAEEHTPMDFLKQQILPILLVLLSYNIRSEMFLLMCPFVATVGIFKWFGEEKVFATKNLKKYLGFLGLIVAGMLLSLVIDFVAYSGKEWREFKDFFNARTQVYDYTWYPSFDEAESFYQEMGVSRSEYALLDNYNFGLDEAIDAELLWSIAGYQEENAVKAPLTIRIKEALTAYKWRTLHEDMPYSYMVLIAYVAVIGLAICKKDISAIWKVPLLVAFRSVSWMYVILANRVPPRISHPLYYIEFIVLCAWILVYSKGCKGKQRWIHCVCTGIFALYACVNILGSVKATEAEMLRRESANVSIMAFDAYAKQNPQNYYYMDVYSTVAFSEKMFKEVDGEQKNYDLVGGWLSGSPLQKDATLPFYDERISEAELLLQDNFYFVIERERTLDFLHEFYTTQGITLNTEVVDEIGNKDNPLVVHEVSALGF